MEHHRTEQRACECQADAQNGIQSPICYSPIVRNTIYYLSCKRKAPLQYIRKSNRYDGQK